MQTKTNSKKSTKTNYQVLLRRARSSYSPLQILNSICASYNGTFCFVFTFVVLIVLIGFAFIQFLSFFFWMCTECLRTAEGAPYVSNKAVFRS